MRCRGALDRLDTRIVNFYIYSSLKLQKEEALEHATNEELNTMLNTLLIKDFIIIGNENFQKEIKSIENKFIHRKIPYLSIIQVRNYLKEKNKFSKYRNFNYIFIIDANDAENNFKELYSLKDDFALNLLLIVYIKNKDTLINKNILKYKLSLPIYIAYITNEILNYNNNQKFCNFYFSFIKIGIRSGLINIGLLPKIDCNPIDINDKYNHSIEDGWELADLVPKEIFNEKIIIGENGGYGAEIGINLLKLFRENNIESLFFDKYCSYFNFQISPDFTLHMTLDVILKQICYAYSLEEEKSFYYIMNRDLRSGNPSKIQKFI